MVIFMLCYIIDAYDFFELIMRPELVTGLYFGITRTTNVVRNALDTLKFVF